MLRTTVIFAATAAMLLAGCGKSSPTSSYNELAHVTATPSPTTYNGQPIATGVDASTVVTQTGSVSLGLNALKDPSNTIASLTVSLAGNGLTQFMTMTAALAVLLYRYSGQQDLRIGAPVANRIRPESEGLIGAFLNTQVLRCRLDGQMSVAGLLEQVRQTVIDGQSHQDLPFDHLVEALQPPRSAAYNPLFQVMCNVQRWEFQQTRQLAGMTVEYCVNDARATKFDLNLEVTDLDQRLGCCLTYSRDLFDEPRIARMARHWQNLLAAMIADPQQRLGELPMLDAGEQDALLTCSGPQLSDTLHGLFAAQAAATPQAPALTFAGQSLSYAELDARANRLARLLRERGVGPEVRVGLALERWLEMVVGLLAILKAGGAYVPLDPEYPLERLHYMIEDSGVRLLLGQPALFEALGALPEGVGRCCPAEEGAALAALDDGPLPAFAQPQHLAYLIYTSGSTGKPKGVAVCHGEIAMHWHTEVESITPSSVALRSNADGARLEIPNDAVYAMIGYRPDVTLLRACGVSYDPETLIPVHDPATFETDIPNFFIAGSVACGCKTWEIFIENGREHARHIIAEIARRS